ncbi:Multidrug resistance protein [Diplodia seriata]|uniref:Multidrug resistance protein n=1 Tax=Diplodia seriata TaxID=420778 RepID=A0ABR3CT37_9PEZI
MCGPALLRLSPEFSRLFWEYNEWIPSFVKGLPRFVIPEAFNTNAILVGTWTALDVFRDPDILARVRREVEQCRDSSTECGLDMDALMRSPLLQAVYAETLRLRVHAYITLFAEREELRIGGNRWSIPPKTMVLVATTPAHLDGDAWNTGLGGRHSVDTFWADRFLVVSGDEERYGPMKMVPTAAVQRGQLYRSDSLVHGSSGVEDSTREEARFVGNGVRSGLWFPFGGGARMCPGRFFAKRAVLLSLALMVHGFDVEIMADISALEMGWKDFGLGVQRPKGKVPFRMTRRRSGPKAGLAVTQHVHG